MFHRYFVNVDRKVQLPSKAHKPHGTNARTRFYERDSPSKSHVIIELLVTHLYFKITYFTFFL